MQVHFRGHIPGSSRRNYHKRPNADFMNILGRLIPEHPVLSLLVIGVILAHAFGDVGPFYMLDEQRTSVHESGMVLDSTATLTSAIGRKPVVLLIDESGSMENEHDQQRLQRYLAELESKNLLLGEISIVGAGTTEMSDIRNLTYGITQAIAEFPDMRTLYVLSDYDTSSALYWENDPATQDTLKTTLTDKKIPLYLGTVRFEPAESLKDLAMSSGGGIVFHQ